MNPMKVGIRLESLGLPLRRALTEAGRLGAGGVQVDAVGDLSPANLSETGRRELRHLLPAHNLELTALGCPLRRGLDAPQDQEPRIEHVRKVLSLSYDLGAPVVVVQAGAVPEQADSDRGRVLEESLRALASHGDRIGAALALETGLESGVALAAYLRRFDTAALGANLDPANLLLHGFDPYESTRALRGLVRHVQARDARRASPSRAAQEVALGQGDIDWMHFLATLEDIEYRGWITVARDAGDSRLADVAAGVALLRRVMP
jgi:sugar phosphate isomerase/epimerase